MLCKTSRNVCLSRARVCPSAVWRVFCSCRADRGEAPTPLQRRGPRRRERNRAETRCDRAGRMSGCRCSRGNDKRPKCHPLSAGRKNPSVRCGKKTVVRAFWIQLRNQTRDALDKTMTLRPSSSTGPRPGAQPRFLPCGDKHVDLWFVVVCSGRSSRSIPFGMTTRGPVTFPVARTSSATSPLTQMRIAFRRRNFESRSSGAACRTCWTS